MLATPINYKNNKMASQMKMAARGGFSSSGIFIRSSSTQTHHLVGGPDSQSNLAIVKLRSPRNQKELQLQALQKQVYEFNHNFWRQHNIEFQQAKSEYVNKLLSTTDLTRNELTSNHLMGFYRSFLNDRYPSHKQYLKEWTIMNFRLSWELFKYRLQYGLK